MRDDPALQFDKGDAGMSAFEFDAAGLADELDMSTVPPSSCSGPTTAAISSCAVIRFWTEITNKTDMPT